MGRQIKYCVNISLDLEAHLNLMESSTNHKIKVAQRFGAGDKDTFKGNKEQILLLKWLAFYSEQAVEAVY